jgi:hypothetical protein
MLGIQVLELFFVHWPSCPASPNAFHRQHGPWIWQVKPRTVPRLRGCRRRVPRFVGDWAHRP